MNYDPFMLFDSLHDHLFDHHLDLFGEPFMAVLSKADTAGIFITKAMNRPLAAL